MKPRLLIITNRFVIGGPAYHVADLASRLQKDFEIMIVGGVAGKGEQTNVDMFASLKNEPVIIEDFSRKANLISDIRAFKKIKKIIRDFKPDIVHTHTSKPGFIGRYAARKAGVKTIIHTFHGNLFEGYFRPVITRIIIKAERFLAKHSSAVIALSPLQKNELTQKYKIAPPEKVHTIFPGINPDTLSISNELRLQFRKRFGIDNDTIVPAIVGRLVKIKNIKLFIKGIKHLKDNGFENVTGAIVGDGPLKTILKEYCNEIGIGYTEYSRNTNDSNIIFTSWCKNTSWIYSGADIVVLTSENEGTPYSLIEAQMSAKPVLAARVGGVPDIVEENKTAFLFDNEQEFFQRLEQLVADENLRKTMGEKGKNFAENNFDIYEMVLKTKELYGKFHH